MVRALAALIACLALSFTAATASSAADTHGACKSGASKKHCKKSAHRKAGKKKPAARPQAAKPKDPYARCSAEETAIMKAGNWWPNERPVQGGTLYPELWAPFVGDGGAPTLVLRTMTPFPVIDIHNMPGVTDNVCYGGWNLTHKMVFSTVFDGGQTMNCMPFTTGAITAPVENWTVLLTTFGRGFAPTCSGHYTVTVFDQTAGNQPVASLGFDYDNGGRCDPTVVPGRPPPSCT